MIPNNATIAAQATPSGRGGLAVVRISGPRCRDVAETILGHLPKPRHAEYLPFRNHLGGLIDEGIALFFPGPHSYTGEDVLELQCHGGAVVVDLLLEAIYQQEVRAARAGEFTLRAYLNDKIDLAQAEAIADLIDATTRQAAQSAVRSMQGLFSRQVRELVDGVIELRVFIEAAIDFPEEEIDFLADQRITERVQGSQQQIDKLLAEAQQGALLREGMTVVLAGRPNAGKSSLLNALAGYERAIVTDIPGTTRDTLREEVAIDGLAIHFIDTAGLRESEDPVEQEGIRRTWEEIGKADRLLLIVDDRTGVGVEEQTILKDLPDDLPRTIVHNKIDLSNNGPKRVQREGCEHIYLTAKEGAGVDLLRLQLKESIGYQGSSEGTFMARRRHLEALNRAKAAMHTAAQCLQSRQGELVAEELREVQQSLNEITGEFGSDELLGRIFESFCIGK